MAGLAPDSQRRRLAAWAAVLCAIGACGGSPAPTPRAPRPASPEAPSAAPEPTLAGPGGLPARILAPVEAPQADILVARRADRGLLLVRRTGRWFTLAFPAEADRTTDTPPAEQFVDVGAAPTDELVASLQATAEGYLVAWSTPQAGHGEVWCRALDAAGHAAGPARVVARPVDPLRWIEILANSSGALLLWEVERAQGRELRVAPWRAGGTLPKPAVAATSVAAWHAVGTADGAALVTVGAGPDRTGAVSFREIAADGALGPIVAVSPTATAQPDVQVATVGNRYLVAWTDTRPLLHGDDARTGDAHVYLATVARGAREADPPRRPVAPVGPQALVGLVPHEPSGGALLAWEPAVAQTARARRINLLRLDGSGAPLGRRAQLDFAATADAPRFADADSGFVALTLAGAALADRSTTPPTIEPGAIVPTVVRFDPALEVAADEPVRIAAFGEPGVPALVRSLSCAGDHCFALAAGGNPPLLAAVDLPVRPSPWKRAAATLPAEAPPLGTLLTTVSTSPTSLAEVATTRVADGRTLLAWVTDVPGPIGRRPRSSSAEEATLALRFVDDENRASPVTTLSQRAISIGGVAATPAVPEDDDDDAAAVLAWTAPANGYPQVFATVLGADGDKRVQRAITRTVRTQRAQVALPNQVSDVDIASDGRSGYLLAWVDSRHGNAEIYAARLDRQLRRQGAERRITEAPGSSTEVRIAIGPERSRLVWSDARDQPEQGVADIYTALIETDTAKKVGAERRLARTEGHSRTPGTAPMPDGAVAWWIEQSATGVGGGGATLRILRLSNEAEPLGPAEEVAPAGGQVTSAELRCREHRCRGVVASVRNGRQRLDALTVRTGTPGLAALRTKRLALIDDGTPQDSSLCAADDELSVAAFISHGARHGGRARYLRLRW